MNVKIRSLNNGVENINNVLAIKIKSKKYNLLIMQNYTSLIGEVDGHIEFVSNDTNKVLDDIKGYYMNINNEFKLILRS